MHRSWRTLKNKTNWTIHTYRRDFDLLSGQRILSSSDAHDDLLQPLTTRSLDPRWSLRLKSLINDAHKTCEIQSGPRSSTITSKRIVQISHHDRNSNSLTDWSLSLSQVPWRKKKKYSMHIYLPSWVMMSDPKKHHTCGKVEKRHSNSKHQMHATSRGHSIDPVPFHATCKLIGESGKKGSCVAYTVSLYCSLLN